MIGLGTGCASGGFKLTRKYSKFINSQNVVILSFLYILISFVFIVTLVIDAVIFNTIDFWEGRVSSGVYPFEKVGTLYAVHNEVHGASELKRSTIKISTANKKLLQEIQLKETPLGHIQLYVDGILRKKVENIQDLPTVTSFDRDGKVSNVETYEPTKIHANRSG